MGNMSKKFINSRWIPCICHLEDIQEEPPDLCVLNATILVVILCCVIMLLLGKRPNLQRREVCLNNFCCPFLNGSLWNPPKINYVSSDWRASKICTF
jgi:hypothetical protein